MSKVTLTKNNFSEIFREVLRQSDYPITVAKYEEDFRDYFTQYMGSLFCAFLLPPVKTIEKPLKGFDSEFLVLEKLSIDLFYDLISLQPPS